MSNQFFQLGLNVRHKANHECQGVAGEIQNNIQMIRFNSMELDRIDREVVNYHPKYRESGYREPTTEWEPCLVNGLGIGDFAYLNHHDDERIVKIKDIGVGIKSVLVVSVWQTEKGFSLGEDVYCPAFSLLKISHGMRILEERRNHLNKRLEFMNKLSNGIPQS